MVMIKCTEFMWQDHPGGRRIHFTYFCFTIDKHLQCEHYEMCLKIPGWKAFSMNRLLKQLSTENNGQWYKQREITWNMTHSTRMTKPRLWTNRVLNCVTTRKEINGFRLDMSQILGNNSKLKLQFFYKNEIKQVK